MAGPTGRSTLETPPGSDVVTSASMSSGSFPQPSTKQRCPATQS